MIPDKIYVSVGTLSSIHPAEEYAFPGWQEKPYSQIRSEQYISKRTILEWLKEEIRIMRESDESPAITNAKLDITEHLLDKLELM